MKTLIRQLWVALSCLRVQSKPNRGYCGCAQGRSEYTCKEGK